MDLEKLKNIPIFNTLDENELKKVLAITKEIEFHKDDMIMREGDEGDTMYLVMEGEVEVSKGLTMKFGDDDYRETEKILTRFRPEDHAVFGEMALIAKDTRSATIIALDECLLLEMNRDDFLKLINNLPELGVKVLVKISELLISRLRQSSQDITRLTTALSIALSK